MSLDGAGRCVLVADDDDMLRNSVAEALELEGYAVVRARNGAEALSLVQQRRPHAIVLDLMMPIMSGWEFLQQCRANALCHGTPVVVLSAYRQLPDEAARLGVDDCIAKPFDLDRLLGTVERLMPRPT